MNTPNDGGSAFPFTEWGHLCEVGNVPRETHPGLSLRDLFAGMALTGVIQTITECSKLGKSSFGGMESSQLAAVTAYQIADAMLAARNKKSP